MSQKPKKFQNSREILKFHYALRQSKNVKFSQRSFAKMLGISSGRLAEIFNGKAPITEKKARAMATKLKLSAEDKLQLLTLVENEANTRLKRPKNPKKSHRLSHDEFSIISDWEHFALMSLIETATFKSDKNWIAKKLEVSVERLETVLQTLLAENLIKIDDNQQISNTYRSMSTLTDIPSDILKKANEECILQGLEKMYVIGPELRDITSLTFPVDLTKLPKAKALIRKFKAKMTELMPSKTTSEIYNLNIQLVPISKIGV
ncbi:MAG: TIGR02147 family protein [Pseudobdellovibrio sp.]|nr:TIGR02147 family protein [Pseudobdellovibrio sp.]